MNFLKLSLIQERINSELIIEVSVSCFVLLNVEGKDEKPFTILKTFSDCCRGSCKICGTGFIICDALRDLVPFVQFKKSEQHPWRSVTFSEASNFTKSNTPPWVFFTFFILYKWYQIAQRITFLYM